MTLVEALGIKSPSLEPEKTLTQTQFDVLQDLPKDLAKNIRDGTATVEEIESFFGEAPKIPPALEDLLLGILFIKKVGVLLRSDQAEEALKYGERALGINKESPVNWTAKGSALLHLERFEEAVQAFRTAFSFRENLGAQETKFLPSLIEIWSGGALLYGLSGIMKGELRTAESGVEEYLHILNEAKAMDLENSVMVPLGNAAGQTVPQEIKDDLEELELMVRLRSNNDRQADQSLSIYPKWAKSTLQKGMDALLRHDIPSFEAAGLKYISILAKSSENNKDSDVEGVLMQFRGALKTKNERRAFEELELYIKLMGIQDPFEGWKALTNEISRAWTPGVSAVQAVREMRK